MLLRPKQWNHQTVVWLDEAGKAGLFAQDSDSHPRAEIAKLLDSGAAVVGVDLLYQGEFLADGKPLTRTPSVKNPRQAAAYTYGYNRAVFAERVQDILTVVSFLKHQQPATERIDLVALDATGPLAAAARAQAREALDGAAINTGGFRFGKVLAIHDVNFLPGGAKYGDIPGLLALGTPSKLWLAGEGDEGPSLLRRLTERSGQTDTVTIARAESSGLQAAAVEWLLRKN